MREWARANVGKAVLACFTIAYAGGMNLNMFGYIPFDLGRSNSTLSVRGRYPEADEIRKHFKSEFGGESLMGNINYTISTPGRELGLLLFHDGSRVGRN